MCVEERGGERGNRSMDREKGQGERQTKEYITSSILYQYQLHIVACVPVFPLSAFHNLVLLQIPSSTQCCWDWFSSFLSQHLSMEGGCSKVLHVCVGTYSMIQYSYVLNVSGSLDTKIFPQAV